MKKTAVLLCSILLLTGCCFNCIEDDANHMIFPKKGKYFCPIKGYDNSYLLDEDIFDVSEKCETWKSEFWQENNPNAYNKCLEHKKLFVERFQLGTCVPILKKVKNVEKSGCLFEYVPIYNKVIRYSCFGPDVPSAIKAIEAQYDIEPKLMKTDY